MFVILKCTILKSIHTLYVNHFIFNTINYKLNKKQLLFNEDDTIPAYAEVKKD